MGVGGGQVSCEIGVGCNTVLFVALGSVLGASCRQVRRVRAHIAHIAHERSGPLMCCLLMLTAFLMCCCALLFHRLGRSASKHQDSLAGA